MAKVIALRKDGGPVKVKNAQMWSLAVKDFMRTKPQPGTIIKTEWLIKAFGLNLPSVWDYAEWHQFNFAWLHNFERFRMELLEEHKIDLRKIKKVGYEVIPPKDQTRLALHDGLRGIAREMNKMAMRCFHVDTSRLSPKAREENLIALNKIQSLRTAFMKHERLTHYCYDLVEKKLKRLGSK